jgi:hypothetical protein
VSRQVLGRGKAQKVAENAGRLPRLGSAALDQIGPVVQSARESAKDLGPAFENAKQRVVPTLETARGQMVDNVAPAIAEAVSTAVERTGPVRAEALRRAEAALAVLRGEPAPRRGIGKGATLGLVVLGAIAGAAGGWLAHRPTQSGYAASAFDGSAEVSDASASAPYPGAAADGGTLDVGALDVGAGDVGAVDVAAADTAAGDAKEANSASLSQAAGAWPATTESGLAEATTTAPPEPPIDV